MKILKILLSVTFWLSLALYLFLLVWKIPLPSSDLIRPELTTFDPVQTAIKQAPYIWHVKDQSYRITPLFDYETVGLVVAEYDSQNWLDYSHKQDPAQTKDLCLIWGENIKNGVYRGLKYSHGEFTCFVNWTEDQGKIFDFNRLSNNHLLPASSKLAALIKSSSVGDQVRIKGRLVNYEILDKDGKIISTRKTSTIRQDRGCEVIMVDDFEILQKQPLPVQAIKSILPKLLFFNGLTNFILFLLVP